MKPHKLRILPKLALRLAVVAVTSAVMVYGVTPLFPDTPLGTLGAGYSGIAVALGLLWLDERYLQGAPL